MKWTKFESISKMPIYELLWAHVNFTDDAFMIMVCDEGIIHNAQAWDNHIEHGDMLGYRNADTPETPKSYD